MRTFVLAVAVVMLAVSFAALPAATASGPAPTAPAAFMNQLKIQVIGETVGLTKYIFSPAVILIPSVPITVNITFFNNQSTASGVQHTFTINDNKGNPVIDTGFVNPQTNVSVVFTINSMTNITFSNSTVTNRSFQPGPIPSGTDNGTIQWYCRPHAALGMVGTIMLATAVPAASTGQNGVFLRAYWIGIIGIVSMIVWIGISYFVIKSYTPHFKDNKAHVRKGLP